MTSSCLPCTTVSMLPSSLRVISVALPSTADSAASRSTLVMSTMLVEPPGKAASGRPSRAADVKA